MTVSSGTVGREVASRPRGVPATELSSFLLLAEGSANAKACRRLLAVTLELVAEISDRAPAGALLMVPAALRVHSCDEM